MSGECEVCGEHALECECEIMPIVRRPLTRDEIEDLDVIISLAGISEELFGKIAPPEPIKVTVNYEYIMNEIRKRTGWLPDDIERVLMELEAEQHN